MLISKALKGLGQSTVWDEGEVGRSAGILELTPLAQFHISAVQEGDALPGYPDIEKKDGETRTLSIQDLRRLVAPQHVLTSGQEQEENRNRWITGDVINEMLSM